jgi:putative nucleotidyltransferase with HDIG domain
MKKNIKAAASLELSMDALVKTIRIPARPSLLLDIQAELAQPEPSPKKLAAVIANDVALSASLLKLTNSSFFGLRLKAKSIEHAVNLLGLEQSALLVMGILARQAVNAPNSTHEKFWDFSSKRAQAMTYLARHIPICSADTAHTFGLFCDIGMPLLSERFPDYASTLGLANAEFERSFTEVEDQQHNTNHAAIGALMARTWGLPEEIVTAILLHHAYSEMEDGATDEMVRGLIALALLAEYAIQKYHGQELFAEWEKGGEQACQFLGIGNDDAADRFDELQELFNHN